MFIADLTSQLSQKEVWVVGDIHGRFYLLQRLLERIGYHPDTHALISLGDMVDRGDNSPDVVCFFQENGYAIRGNHEQMWLDMVESFRAFPYSDSTDIHPAYLPFVSCSLLDRNGFGSTLQQFMNANIPAESWLGWFAKLPVAFVVGDYLLVHAGVDPTKPFENQSEEDLLWIREPFISTAQEIPTSARMRKRLVVGHNQVWPMLKTVGIPIIRPDRIMLDLGAANDVGIGAFCLTDDRFLFVEGASAQETRLDLMLGEW